MMNSRCQKLNPLSLFHASIAAFFTAQNLNTREKRTFFPEGGPDKSRKKRMRLGRPRLEFRVELAPQKPGMVLDFDYLHKFSVGAVPADLHPESGYYAFIGVVEFISMTVSFGYLFYPISGMRKGVFLYDAGIRAETHCASLLGA